jgi:predicted ATPase
MNEKLKVKNFGPIREAELDLKKVTVFIGPQGSGKSTLAKLVAICKEEERPELNHQKIPIKFREMAYGISSYKSKKTLLKYESNILKINYNGKYKNTPTKLGAELLFQTLNLSQKLKQVENLEQNLKIDLHMDIMVEYSELLEENHLIAPIYIPTERFLLSTISSSLYSLISNDINLPKILTEFGVKYSIAATNDTIDERNTYKSKIKLPKYIEVFDLQFQHKNGQDFLIDTKNDFEVNLKYSASGMQSSIPLILVVRHEFSHGNTHFIVEEPELNLFPTTQKQLVGYLVDKCTQNGNELLMTTHSPYVLSAINNLIFAYKVAHEVPEMADEVAKIIPREQWLNPDDVAAYYVGDGTVKSIMAEKFGLIGENELDAISEDIAGERDDLFRILKSKKRETVD